MKLTAIISIFNNSPVTAIEKLIERIDKKDLTDYLFERVDRESLDFKILYFTSFID